MAAWKIAPALACGNTVVLKPAETTPLTALLLAEDHRGGRAARLASSTSSPARARRARRSSTIRTSTRSPSPARTDVGKRIQTRASPAPARSLTLELGGKAANIVFADAPIDQAVEGIVNGIYFNQGHVCCAGSRLLVEESVHDVVDAQAQATACARSRRRSARQEHRHRRHQLARCSSSSINELVELGRGRRAPSAISAPCDAARARASGSAPTFFTGVAQSRRIAREEIFGPVLAVHDLPHAGRGDREGEQHDVRPLRRRLDGQGREDLQTSRRSCKAGVIWANTYNKFDPSSPFGGYKESGFGREGGRQGLSAYLEVE